jgi:pimeloyl-ACP methyl ester carboxylesterase
MTPGNFFFNSLMIGVLTVRGQKGKGCLKKILLLCALMLFIGALAAGGFFLRMTKAAPAANGAFRWPYYLYTPTGLEDNRILGRPIHLLVLPNNTGTTSDDPSVDDRSALATVPLSQMVFGDMDVAILVPTFPRPGINWQVYTQALDRDALMTDLPDLQRIDLQLSAMIDDATNRLSQQGWTVESKVLMMGFSASGMFVNRFTVLHPERVLAAVVGSPGGWPIAPVSAWQGRSLRYPIGMADLEELTGEAFDLEAFRRVPMLFFIGDRDENDSVPYPDSYDDEDRALIFDLFGGTPVERWDDAEAIYNSIGAYAEFRKYPGVAHTITLEEIFAIRKFFERAIAGDKL